MKQYLHFPDRIILYYNIINRNYFSTTPLLEYYLKEKDIWKKYTIV